MYADADGKEFNVANETGEELLKKYFHTSDWENKGRLCLDPEDIAEAEAINREMRKVQREAANRFALSAQLARGLILRADSRSR